MSAWEKIEPRTAWTIRLAALGFWHEGRLLTAADIASLAERAREKILARPDISDTEQGGSRSPALLQRILEYAPDPAYKLFDWLTREWKKDPEVVFDQSLNGVIPQLLGEAASIFSEYQKKNKPLPNYKAKDFDFDALERFVNENTDVLDALGIETGPGYEQDDESNIVYTFPDGYTIRRLNGDRDDLITEGEVMQHCVRHVDDYNWDDKIYDGYSDMYSLRDARNYPHVTMEFVGQMPSSGSWLLSQIYGKQDRAPIPKYQKYVDDWLKELETAQGIHVSRGYHDYEWDEDEEDEEHEPEHLESNDETVEHPDGEYTILDLGELEGWADDAVDNAQDFQVNYDDGHEVRDDDGDYWFEYPDGRQIAMDAADVKTIVSELTDGVLSSTYDLNNGYYLAQLLAVAAAHATKDGYLRNARNAMFDALDAANGQIAAAEQDYQTYRPQEEQLFPTAEEYEPNMVWGGQPGIVGQLPRHWQPDTETWGETRDYYEADRESIQNAKIVLAYLGKIANSEDSLWHTVPLLSDGYSLPHAVEWVKNTFPPDQSTELPFQPTEPTVQQPEQQIQQGGPQLHPPRPMEGDEIQGQIGEPQPAGGPTEQTPPIYTPNGPVIYHAVPHPWGNYDNSLMGWDINGRVWVYSPEEFGNEWHPMTPGVADPNHEWNARITEMTPNGLTPRFASRRMSFKMYAASIAEMANDMMRRLQEREDYEKLRLDYAEKIPTYRGIDSPEEKNHAYHLFGLLFARLINQYPESYKLWPWAFTKLKKGAWDRQGINHAADIVGQAGRLIQDMRTHNRLPKGFDVNGLSFQDLEEWLYEHAAEDVEDDWNQKNVVFQFSDGWTIQKLTDKDDLAKEGQEMGHCVGGYDNAVESGETEIYSLRDKRNQPHATIELSPPVPAVVEGDEGHTTKAQGVRQISGKQNSEPIDEYRQKIAEWFNHMNVSKEGPRVVWTDDYYDYENEIDARSLNQLMEWWEDFDPAVPQTPEGTLLIKSKHDAPYGLPHGNVIKSLEDVDWDKVLKEAAISLSTSYEPHNNRFDPDTFRPEDIGKAMYYAAWLTKEPLAPLQEKLDEEVMELGHEMSDLNWEWLDKDIRDEMEKEYGDPEEDEAGTVMGVDWHNRTLNGSEDEFESAFDDVRDKVEEAFYNAELGDPWKLTQYLYDLHQTHPVHTQPEKTEEHGIEPPVFSEQEMPRSLPTIQVAGEMRRSQDSLDAPPPGPQPMTAPTTPEEVKGPEEPKEAAFRFASVIPTYLDPKAGPLDLSRVDYARWVEAAKLPLTYDPPASLEIGPISLAVYPDGEIRVLGRQRLAALRALGWKLIPCEQVRYEGGAERQHLVAYAGEAEGLRPRNTPRPSPSSAGGGSGHDAGTRAGSSSPTPATAAHSSA